MKKFLLITTFIALTTFSSQAQSREISAGVPANIVRLYPNPATTVINFDFQKASEKGYSLQVYSFMGGRKMVEFSNLTDRASINLSDFARGVYIYQLRDKTGRVIESGKFQVSK